MPDKLLLAAGLALAAGGAMIWLATLAHAVLRTIRDGEAISTGHVLVALASGALLYPLVAECLS